MNTVLDGALGERGRLPCSLSVASALALSPRSLIPFSVISAIYSSAFFSILCLNLGSPTTDPPLSKIPCFL